MLFIDRIDAGKQLAEKLIKYKNAKDTIVLALPRGGVIVGKAICEVLNLPLDIVIPRKIGAPFNPELAIGAICEDQYILNKDLISSLDVNEKYIKDIIEDEKKEAKRREKLYRKNKGPLILKNKTIILVDDGIATGATMHAAIKFIKTKDPKKLIVGSPIALKDIYEDFKKLCDEIICLYTPLDFMAIGQFYENFQQTTDEEVINILKFTN